MARPGDNSMAVVVAAATGLLVAVALGSWWTATAVVEGSTGAVLLRFVLSVAGGCYYLAVYRVATGRPMLG